MTSFPLPARNPPPSSEYEAARRGSAYRLREAGVLDVTGEDRVEFLQGQLTQDVKTLSEGETRPTAGLTPKGKLVFLARLLGLSDRLRLLVPASSREGVVQHLKKYAVFQRVAIEDRSEEFVRIGLYGPSPKELSRLPLALVLPGEGEFSGEILLPKGDRAAAEGHLAASGAVPVGEKTAEILRLEAGRPRFGADADESHLLDEIRMDAAISTTKGCYVGQEIVARLRTYGRVNRRLVGYRFPEGLVPPGSRLEKPGEAPGKIEWGRVTSALVSPRFGPIGLGFAFREVPAGGRLVAAESPEKGAVVAELPFA